RGGDALKTLRQRRVGCVVLDPALPDMTLADFAAEWKREPAVGDPPVLGYGDKTLVADHEAGLRQPAQTGALLPVSSPDPLLDQAAYFLHCAVAKLPAPKKELLEQVHQTDLVLAGKKVLIVDDDVRNIFALTSILEWHNIEIVAAETGRDAIALLQAQPDID